MPDVTFQQIWAESPDLNPVTIQMVASHGQF